MKDVSIPVGLLNWVLGSPGWDYGLDKRRAVGIHHHHSGACYPARESRFLDSKGDERGFEIFRESFLTETKMFEFKI